MPFTESANKMDFRFAYRRYKVPFRTPVRTAWGAWRAREGLYVRAGPPGGPQRYGEASPIPSFGPESVDDGEAFCRSLGESVDGQALARAPAELGSLRNALACAMGEEPGAPLRRSLGVAALLPAGRAALAEARGRAEAGFRVFKWKVGVGAADDEMALLDDLLACLPASSRIRLDANGAWSLRTAERWLNLCAQRPVEFVEQPVAPGAKRSDDQLAGLCADHPVPLALDESIRCDGDVGRWLDAGWPGYFVVKPALLGDVRGVLGRLAGARARVVFSSSLETGIGARAALRAAFAWPGEMPALGFGVWPLFADPGFDGPRCAPSLRIEDVDRIDPEALWNAVS
jgi:o-succinylbenzoate synthase